MTNFGSMEFFSSTVLTVLCLIPHLLLVGALWHYIQRQVSRGTLPLLILITILSLLATVPSPLHVMNLSITPDSPEYLAVADRFLQIGKIDLVLGDATYPSRYPWGFSVFIVAPALMMFSFLGSAGGIALITLYATLGVVASFLIGFRIGGAITGVFSCIFLLLLPMYTTAALELLTYTPSAATGLLFLLFVASMRDASSSKFAVVGASTSLLLVTSCRPLGIFLALPAGVWLAWHAPRAAFTLLFASLPSVALGISYLVYNHATFGELLRTGYSYWCSIPYDFPTLLLNSTYLEANAIQLLSSIGLYTALAAFGLWYGRHLRDVQLLFLTAVAFVLPLAVFHLFYFYPSELFFIQGGALLVPLVALGQSKIIRCEDKHAGRAAAAAVFITALILIRNYYYNSETRRIDLVDEMITFLPSESLVITGIDPISFVLMTERRRKLFPLPASRNVGYANKLATPLRPSKDVAPGTDPFAHRHPALIATGSFEAIPHAGSELLPRIHALIHEGKNVFLETAFTTKEDQLPFRTEFNVISVTPRVYKLIERTKE